MEKDRVLEIVGSASGNEASFTRSVGAARTCRRFCQIHGFPGHLSSDLICMGVKRSG